MAGQEDSGPSWAALGQCQSRALSGGPFLFLLSHLLWVFKLARGASLRWPGMHPSPYLPSPRSARAPLCRWEN